MEQLKIQNRYKEKIIMYMFKAFIILAFSFGMFYYWTAYLNPAAPVPFFRLGNYFLGICVAAIYVFLVNVFGGFQVGTSPVWDLIYSQIISIGFLQVFCYMVFSLLSFKLLPVVPFIIFFAAFSAFAALWCTVSDFVYFKLHKPHKTVVVFENVDSYLSLKGIRSMDKRFTVLKTFNSEKTTLNELFEQINCVDAVFLCGVPSDYRNEVVKYCIATGKTVYVKPKISDTIIRGGKTIQLMNVPVYRCKRSDAGLIYIAVKRLLDILLSLIAIIISSPVAAGVAIAIKLYDGGDVFYKQTRLTKNGKKFELLKFRSMIQNAEKDGVARLACEGDNRITPVGKFIRKTRLDELPQLFNILKGDMSFVGPRPERPEIAAQYEKDMPEFALRLQIKAGLTGYAQVYGKYNTPPYDKVQMDLMYVANQSLLEDFKLMLMTFKILFVPESTQGVKKNQVTAKRDNSQKKKNS